MKRSWKFLFFVLVLGLTALVASGVFAEGETTSTPYLGVRVIPNAVGAQVIFVEPQSPAQEAGIQYLDVITHIDGQAVRASTLEHVLQTVDVGNEITLSIKRGEDDLVLTATLAERSDYATPPLKLKAVTYNGDTQEWYIEALSSDEPLYEAGLQPGDALQKFDDTAYSPAALLEYLNGKDSSDMIHVAVKRGEEILFVDVSAEVLQTLPLPVEHTFNHFEFPFDMFFAKQHGYLGVISTPMNEQIAETMGIEYREGGFIERVLADSPAATAGLQANDIVLDVNGEVVDSEHTLQDRLTAYEVGDTIELNVYRDGEDITLSATLVSHMSISSLNVPMGSSDMGGNK